ncbi:DNA polymerase III subunit epsilon [Leucothrix sargassi]|nr:DNA polymerase III subunit epsilon [Leucothrix sargassi]
MTDQLDWLDKREEKPCTTLSGGFPEKMVLLDLETTGGKVTFHRVIEVGLLIVEHGKIIERWSTLVDPETPIPPFIQRLTGITESAMSDAPFFSVIAEELHEKLKDRVLVAHNARFDYGFLKNEFNRVGIKYSTKPLCSVKLSRKLFPQFKRHGLSEIIKRFDFGIKSRHRAMDDAEVIWKLFLKMSGFYESEEIDAACIGLLKRPALPMHLDASEIDKLPKTPGVYYFYDTKGSLLYVGKSVNIRDRVMSHFTSDHSNPKDLQMSGKIAHIDFKKTPTDLGAQLLESREIKALNPYFNRRLKKITKLFQLQLSRDELGYDCLRIVTVEDTADNAQLSGQFGLFRTRNKAVERLEKLAQYYFLCQKLCGLQASEKPSQRTACFGYQLKRCFGPCCEAEPPEKYNERVDIALKELRYRVWPWPSAILLEERGEDEDNTAWHLLNEWRYIRSVRSQEELYELGFVFAESDAADLSKTESESSEESVEFDLDTYLILVRFLLNPEQMKSNRLKVRALKLAEY